MPLDRLDHYFVYASDLERTRAFYSEVLGLEQGPRPDFGFPGFWFYLEDRPVVHVGNEEFEGGYTEDGEERNLSFERREIPDFSLSQLFINDPDGVTIELNFFHADD